MTITVPAPKAPYYAPANGADSIEFWSADWTTLIEVVLIASLSGTTLTLQKALNNDHAIGENIRVRVGRFVPVRGPNGMDGGFKLLGTNAILLQHENDVTDIIPTGLLLSVILITTADAGNRALAVNFILREP